MSKKTKKGKQRKDSFYHKAKIAGFRARSAYKLIQLNSKYEFLQRSRVCVDLCAAPGSWMQVAKKYMPLSSIIVGIDLFPIQPMQGAISIQGDITTEKARQDIKATLKTWKADVVLHDGAPNVGQNWLHDAYQQNLLVLHSFKLACELLQKGGWFVTKVFRSKDYFSLEYIFRKLFKRVEATKPQASRYESAEIFVVCQGYLDPAKIDPQFFSPKHVFQELNMEPNDKLNLLKPDKKKAKAEGYSEGATTLYKRVPVTEFVKSPDYIELLQGASEIEFDDEAIKNHPLTTYDIIENCKDIKVLGRKDLRLLITWRKKLQEDYKAKQLKKKEEEGGTQEPEKTEEEKEEEELDELQKKIMAMKAEQALMEKSAKKRKAKDRKKLEEKMRLKSVIPGDSGPTEVTHEGLFDLNRLAQVQNVDAVVDQDADILYSESEEEEDPGPQYVVYHKDKTVLDKSGRFYITKEEAERQAAAGSDSDSDSEDEGLGIKEKPEEELPEHGDKGDDEDAAHPLITDLVGDFRAAKRARKAENWFSQDVFSNLETEVDEDYELEAAIAQYKSKGGMMMTKDPANMNRKELKKYNMQLKKQQKKEQEKEEAMRKKENGEVDKKEDISDSGKDSDSDAESDIDVRIGPELPNKSAAGGGGTLANPKKRKKGEELDPVGLALATKMIHSKKSKRDIMDNGWNRYMNGGEDDMPSWFAKDENKHNKIRVEVEPEDLRMYRDRSKDVNARTIKKVVEAKARKQRRVKRRMEKARKKSENITNNAELSEREKAQEVKKLYKKAMDPLKKKDTNYIVMKKKNMGQKPKGTKGPYKMVDKRLKKDSRAQKRADQKKKKFKGRK